MRFVAGALVMFFGFIGCATVYKSQGERQIVSLENSRFEYRILTADSDPKKKRLDLKHVDKAYTGPLAKISFKERHLKVFELASKLLKKGCDSGVASLGNIVLSRDPETNPEDPQAEHPQYEVWEFICK